MSNIDKLNVRRLSVKLGTKRFFIMKNMFICIKLYILGNYRLFSIFRHNRRGDQCIFACGVLSTLCLSSITLLPRPEDC